MNFLIVDQNKNVLLIPGTNPVLPKLIESVGIENVIPNATTGELVAFIKDFLKASPKEEK